MFLVQNNTGPHEVLCCNNKNYNNYKTIKAVSVFVNWNEVEIKNKWEFMK